MAVGQATELTPYLVYMRVKEALERGTSLRAADVLLGSTTTPAPLLDRQFRLDPQTFDFTPDSRARPGDVVMVTEVVVVWLTHEVAVDRAEGAWQVASSDFVAALKALLTSTTVSRLGAPKGGRVTRRQVGGIIEQAFPLALTYHITLPEAS